MIIPLPVIESCLNELRFPNTTRLMKDIKELHSSQIIIMTNFKKFKSEDAEIALLSVNVQVNKDNEAIKVPLQVYIGKRYPEKPPLVKMIPFEGSTILDTPNRDHKYYISDILRFWNPNTTLLLLFFDIIKTFNHLFPYAYIRTVKERIASLQCIPFSELNIQENIGKGGYSTVYKAKYHNTDVAIKWMQHPDYALNISSNPRALREIRFYLCLSGSPYICQLYGYCNYCDYPMYIMQYAEHGDLFSYIHNKDINISLQKMKSISLECAFALKHLHSLHIIHGDIKSQNYLLTSNYSCILCDFGNVTVDPSIPGIQSLSSPKGNVSVTATSPSAIYPPSSNNTSSPTVCEEDYTIIHQYCKSIHNKQRIIGTVGWIAPELLNGCPFSLSSDIYAFGVLLAKVKNNQIQPQIPSSLPNEISTLLHKCWSLPSNRPSINEVINTLQSWNPYQN
ncbi:hypothetical protein WA158_002039 [Blastocystis sp. Blastoise]